MSDLLIERDAFLVLQVVQHPTNETLRDVAISIDGGYVSDLAVEMRDHWQRRIADSGLWIPTDDDWRRGRTRVMRRQS